jgi:hypothetical protein
VVLLLLTLLGILRPITMMFKGMKWSVFALSLIFVACSGRVGRDRDGKKYDLSLRLFAGGRYYYTISNEVNTVIQVNGKEPDSSNIWKIETILECQHIRQIKTNNLLHI